MDSVETITMGRGKLVALEGDVDLVSTQLRLLPPSQKILILPSILENFPQLQDNETFNPRSFIRNVHKAFTKRTHHAQSFLKSSTSMQPKLVFTHGGSVNARSICITRIAENITNGKIDEAEVLFNEIVQDGVAGLLQYGDKQDRPKTESKDMMEDAKRGSPDVAPEDASTAAMKAADFLDREAAGSEADEHIDDAEATLCGETPLAEYDGRKTLEYKEDESEDDENVTSEASLMNEKDNFEESKKTTRRRSKIPVREFIFAAPQGEEIKRTMIILPQNSTIWDRRNNSGSKIPHLAPFSTVSYASMSTSCGKSSSLLDDDIDTFSPGIETLPSTPVVYGEACLVDMQSNESDSPPLRKIKSVDRMYPDSLPTSQSVSSPKSPRQTASFCHSQPRPMVSNSGPAIMPEYFQTVTRTSFVKASETTIRRSPIGSDCASSSKSSMKAPSIKALAAVGGSRSSETPEVNVEKEMNVFEDAFPIVEDLIINLIPTGSNEIFEMVLASYKNGTYPVFPKVDLTSTKSDEQLRPTTSNLTSDSESDNVHGKRNTYDPYAYHPNARTQWPVKYVTEHESPNSVNSSTPRRDSSISDKVIEISPLDSTNPVSLQNSLRQIFSVVLPTTDGYSQHIYPVASEMERLWKPVFKIDESGSIGESSRTVDQIVALGCEVGVKPDFFSQISGQIERLGNKKNGLSRSGKVDIKYFIANVMQSHLTAATDSILSPDVLAALIVPQLESFLSTNSSTRFLILQYTSAHLGVILALQRLIGSDILKVAGILDTLSSDPPSFTRPRTPREINPLSNEATLSRPTSRRVASLSLKHQFSSSSNPPIPIVTQIVSFSKANYLIPTTATDAEITVFLSGIWKALMERSSFYNPELPEVEPPISITSLTIRPNTPRLLGPKSPSTTFPQQTPNSSDQTSFPPFSYRAPKTDKIARVAGRTNEHKYAQSIASTMHTTASEKGRREDKAWENFYIADEDSEDDEYDKMILGRQYKMIVPESRVVKKSNTKKALKWLGLS